MKKLKLLITLLIILIISGIITLSVCNSKIEIRTVSSKNTLKRIYDGSNFEIPDFFIGMLTTPWSFMAGNLSHKSQRYETSSYDSYSSVTSRN